MAATDQTYRNQRALDIVFAVSCILMLLSVIWMFVQDYNREFKAVQREFRNVEESMNERLMLEKLPDPAEVETRRQAVVDAKAEFTKAQDEIRPVERELMARRDRQDSIYRTVKADFASESSNYNIAIEHYGKANEANKARMAKEVEDKKKLVDELQAKLNQAQRDLDAIDKEFKEKVRSKLDGPQQRVAQAEDDLKKLTGVFDRFAKATAQKRWKFGDTFRALPILDAFESPTKIQQIHLPELTIDYGGFKDVPRYDRCISCHLGIERGTFDRKSLLRLTRTPEMIQEDIDKAQARRTADNGDEIDRQVAALQDEMKAAQGLQDRLDKAHEIFAERQKAGEDLGFDPKDIPSKVRWLKLKPGQITQYAAHPRLDLFVDSNSPHPAEKFGCTICHSGQGSATDFVLAAHSPSTLEQEHEWKKEYGWGASHDWDFPMTSSRFLESTCLKCHYQVTDLVRHGSKEEAPKLLRGYNLVQEFGCFGCHEISGVKSGRGVGPDLRLEPQPALQYLSASEQERAKTDPLNLPGAYRKVGPSLRRLSEKTNQSWARRWIESPRTFRPDTKMPHFYGLSNNNAKMLQDNDTGQEAFPSTEIYAIARYLFDEAKGNVAGNDTYRTALAGRVRELQTALKTGLLKVRDWKELQDTSRRLGELALMSVPTRAAEINLLMTRHRELQDRLQELYTKQDQLKAQKPPEELGDDEKAEIEQATRKGGELDDVTKKLIDEGKIVPLSKQIVDSHGTAVPNLPALPEGEALHTSLDNGRRLFTEKGCLACHSHDGTAKKKAGFPVVAGQATFGPNLSRIAAKIAPAVKDAKDLPEARRRWLIQWLLNPTVYHPRTRMPITHLSVSNASDVANWLLSQEVKDWDQKDLPRPSTTDLVALARVYLAKAPGMTAADVDSILPPEPGVKPNGIPKERLAYMPFDADERRLNEPSDDNLLWYIGRKAITRQGCFGCHDVPGFETAKPIGTALNDWGRKDPDRIAFEDADVYVKNYHNIVDRRADANDPKKPAADWHAVEGEVDGHKVVKTPYEKYFYRALEHHQREGFLHQKLQEPRSFDYHRLRAWDDRLRMPQFRFARTRRKADETDEAYQARQSMEEDEAREAVMTFILGLIADPIPLKYLNNPDPDKLAEAKGRQVLDKFNCAGCHQVRPGVYDFKPTKLGLQVMKGAYDKAKGTYGSDYFFQGHNAWAGTASRYPDRLTAIGTNARSSDVFSGEIDELRGRPLLLVRLTDALRFTGNDGVVRDIRAGEDARIIPEELVARAEPFGGTFTDLMVPYLLKKNSLIYKDDSDARAVLPPPLIREGERVQPRWLYDFLLNPPPIRPESFMVLRMPKFNMSPEDAQALVNYFGAVSRMENPGAGITYPYLTIPQQEAQFWRNRTRGYVHRLEHPRKEDATYTLKERVDVMKPFWEEAAKKRLADLQVQLDAAEAAFKKAGKDKNADQEAQAKKTRDELKADVDRLKKEIADKDFKSLRQEWQTERAYAVDGYRLLTNQTPCLSCHSVGGLNVPGAKGPNLSLTAERLRPEWVKLWIANPKRMFPYVSVMPQNFPKMGVDVKWKQEFVGTPLEQVTALRDVLMDLPRLRDLPPPRAAPAAAAAGGK